MATIVAEETAPAMAGLRTTKWLFVVASFLGSSLLFLIQPMVARLLLPIAGGSSALWNTAMVFFQVSLLVAYVFAHLAATRLRARVHTIVQAVLLLAPLVLVLPVSVPAGWTLPSSANVSMWALGTLFVIVGLPFFAISTASPTLQRWFSLTGHPEADDPYFLYAAGNIGSVLALVSYPLAIEPLLTLRQQGWFWTIAYALFVVTSVLAGTRIRNAKPGRAAALVDQGPADAPLDREGLWRQRLTWIGWAAVPSALLLGVTNYITTDLASFPLLWIIPLLGYLLSYVLVFGRDPEPLVAKAGKVVFVGLVPLVAAIYFGGMLLFVSIVVQLVWFFAAAVVCHGRLAADRPVASRLTEFYVLISIGGAIGGTLTVLVAPIIFPTVMEYPLAIALVLLIAPMSRRRLALARDLPIAVPVVSSVAALIAAVAFPSLFALLLLVAIVSVALTMNTQQALALALGGLLLYPQVISRTDNISTSRTPFGVYGVDDRDGFRTLAVGTTNHGTQDLSTTDAPTPTSYYHPSGPLGQIFAQAPTQAEVGVVGLGAGAIAAWAEPGDTYHFYEIDPEMVEIAEDPELFTFLSETPADLSVEVIDGRLGVARASARFDILVLDAFSSDAVPVHLMTLEAAQTYVDRLGPEGLLVFNISNRYFDLEPVLGRIAAELGLTAATQIYFPPDADEATGATPSRWVVMSPSAGAIGDVMATSNEWQVASDDSPLWTDDYSFVLGALDL